MKTNKLTIGSLLVAASMILAACGGAASPTSAPAATTAGEPTAAAATEATTAPEATTATEPTAEGEATAEATATAEGAAGAEATATGSTAAGGEAKTITIWHQWDGKYLDAITKAFDDYEASHPGVTIDLSKPEDVSNALNVAIPGGQGPDIIGWANDKIGEQALRGNIVSLNDLGITSDFLSSTYEPAAVNGVQWQDQIWALPETQEAIALVYNRDVVSDTYLVSDPMDFAGLLEKATAFQKDTGKVLVCNQGFGANDAYHVAPIYFGFGVPSFVDEEGKAYLNTPEAIQAAQWLADMSKVSLTENSYDICAAALAEGRVGMWWTGPWAIAGIEASNVDYGILPMGKPFVGIKTMMISKNAVDRGNQELALDIIKYYTSAEVQKQLALVNKTIPAATAAVQDPEVSQLSAVVDFGKAAALGVPMSPSPFSSAQWDPVGKASQAVWTGAQTPEAAVADAQKAIEDAISQMQ